VAKIEARAIDAGLVALKSADDAAAVDWWKKRFALLAGIPTDAARAGALVPQFRQLAELPEAERRRLTRARMQAFLQAPGDQRQAIIAARQLASAIDPRVLASDDAVVQELVPEVPGAEEMQRQMRP
jgi:predicted component of type VI protein secretion system